MRDYCVDKKLRKLLDKLIKKDKLTHDAIAGKIEEIISSEDLNHYKNLRKPLQNLKRVHVNKSFVLVFRYELEKNRVVFIDFDHHDKIYNK